MVVGPSSKITPCQIPTLVLGFNKWGLILRFLSSNCRLEMMQSHTDCICLTFLHFGFSNESSTCLLERVHIHSGCICFTFLHCVFSNVSSNCLPERMQSHIGCIYLTFLHCVFSNVSSNHLHIEDAK